MNRDSLLRPGRHACVALVMGLVSFLGFACSGPRDAARERPNVLLFLVDDLRFDAFPSAGNTYFESVGLGSVGFERLAREGANFREAFVTTSLCCPSRASIFTGQLVCEHHVDHIFGRLADDVPIFPDLLKAEGYETGYVGKWHLNRNSAPDPAFDRWVSFTAGTPYIDPVVTRGFAKVQLRGHLTDKITNHALFFLRQPRDVPFFLTVAHLAPHEPYVAQERFRDRFAELEVPLPPSASEDDRVGKPDWLACREMPAEDIPQYVRDYYSLVAGVDESVAMILAELDTLGVLDDTLVVLLSDNGMLMGEHRLNDKRVAYEESMRIPLLVRYPKWFPERVTVTDNIALNLDITATVLDAVGLEAPPGVRGFSLRRIASGEAKRNRFLYQYFRSPSTDSLEACTPHIEAVRTREWKYIVSGKDRFEELYDLVDDPFERVNVVGEREELVEEARGELEEMLGALGYGR